LRARFTPFPAQAGWVATIREWTPFFHGGVALSLADLTCPFIFAIDANEPLSETIDNVKFH
jgi:hypothetical protein